MKNYLKLFSFGIIIFLVSCNQSDDNTINPTNSSYLPMKIGNYWKTNDNNITRITDTVRIQGNLYYEFNSLIGGDVISKQYLRIDENQNLIESFPENPNISYIQAKFNEPVGSTFWTINDQSVNDFKVSVLNKEESTITFEFERIYHTTANDKHTVSYRKGLGWNNYKEIKIDDEIFNLD